MRHSRFAVAGEGVSRLVPAIRRALDPGIVYDGDGVTVVIAEEFDYWRTSSGMTATVIVDRIGDSTRQVEVVVSGGASGWSKLTLGAERKVLDRVCRKLDGVFEDLHLREVDVDRSAPARGERVSTGRSGETPPEQDSRSPAPTAPTDDEADPPPDPECAVCGAEFGSVAFQCEHCSELHCSDHRSVDDHGCHGSTTDYSTVDPDSAARSE